MVTWNGELVNGRDKATTGPDKKRAKMFHGKQLREKGKRVELVNRVNSESVKVI